MGPPFVLSAPLLCCVNSDDSPPLSGHLGPIYIMMGPREGRTRGSNWVGGAECGDAQCLDHDIIEGFPKWAVDFV